jgi:hypothetical protein
VAFEYHLYLTSSKAAELVLDQDLKDIEERKAEIEGVISRLGKHSSKLDVGSSAHL